MLQKSGVACSSLSTVLGGLDAANMVWFAQFEPLINILAAAAAAVVLHLLFLVLLPQFLSDLHLGPEMDVCPSVTAKLMR